MNASLPVCTLLFVCKPAWKPLDRVSFPTCPILYARCICTCQVDQYFSLHVCFIHLSSIFLECCERILCVGLWVKGPHKLENQWSGFPIAEKAIYWLGTLEACKYRSYTQYLYSLKLKRLSFVRQIVYNVQTSLENQTKSNESSSKQFPGITELQ